MNTVNSGGRVVTAIQGATRLASSAAFKLGYEDVIKSGPYRYDLPSKREGVDYARGRNFAIWCKANNAPRSTWRNGVAAKTVIERIVRSIWSEYVI